MRSLTRLCRALAFALPLSITLLPARRAAAATDFTVNSLDDTHDADPLDGICADSAGACTLRAAIEQASTDAATNVIGFSVNGTINLTGGLHLAFGVTINGPGANLLTVRRDTGGDYNIFIVGPPGSSPMPGRPNDATISGLTISNGKTPVLSGSTWSSVPGGGILNSGTLTLVDCVISGNSTGDSPAVAFAQPGAGGGIFNEGILTMTGCTVSGNSTGRGGEGFVNRLGGTGGGIANSGWLTMTDCLVTNNRTGDGGNASGDGTGGSGGGIANLSLPGASGIATLTDCTVSNNRTGHGGTAQIFLGRGGSGGSGGGIYNSATMTLIKSTIGGNVTGNGADAQPGVAVSGGNGGSGGGVYNFFDLTAVNCVVSGNTTGRGGARNELACAGGNGGDGGGIANSLRAPLKLSQSTVVFNQTGVGGSPAGDCGGRGEGGGISGGGRLRSNIIALNTIPRTSTSSSSIFRRFDLAGSGFDSRGYNYVGRSGDACCLTSTDRLGLFADPNSALKLDPSTLIPLPDSPALDSALALDTDGQPVTTDKRGAPRPFDFPTAPPQTGGDDSDMGAFERQSTDPTPTPTPTPTTPTTVQFADNSYSVVEGCVQTEVTITRAGPKGGTTVATYAVTDFSVPGASQRGDFTYMKSSVTFAPGEDAKAVPVLISEDAYAEGPESFIVFIVGVQGGQLGAPNPVAVQIVDNDTADGTANPIDDNATFVGQHYHDFLGRQADPAGHFFWSNQLSACGGDAGCIERKRVDVSAAFFLSIEFQQTSYFVIRVNKAAFGNQPGNPRYLPFLEETHEVGDVIVGGPGWEQALEAKRQRYVEQFVARADFQTAHGGQGAEQYIDSLFAGAGATPAQAERDAALSAFGTGDTAGRALALRSVVESGSVYNKLYNPAFVLMQYFAYLRRNPDGAPDNNFDGYNFWLAKLDRFTLPGEDARDESVALARVRRAEMVRAFLLSAEYRGRFQGDSNRGS